MYTTQHLSTFMVALVMISGIQVCFSSDILSGPGSTSILLDGTTNFVTIPSDVSSIAGKSFSIEAWVQVPEFRSGQYIVSRFQSSSTGPTDAENDFSLQVNAQGHVVLAIGGQTEFGFLIISQNPIPLASWVHVAFAIEYADINNDAPYRASLYVDDYSTGSLVRDVQSTYWYGPGYSRVVLLNEVITLGKYVNDASPTGVFFHGQIDEVRVWQGARSASDVRSYELISIDQWRSTTWALTSAQGGTSSNLLAASYNFNQLLKDGNTIYDQSQHASDATLSGTKNIASNSVNLIQYAYVTGEVPLFIPLYGLDSRTVQDSSAIQFTVEWVDTEIGGELYNYDSHNSGTPNNTQPLYPYQLLHVTPGIGRQLTNGASPQVDHTDADRVGIVYIYKPTNGATHARFRYFSVSGGVASAVTEVRLVVSCAGDRGAIDECGVCNGDNSTCAHCVWDICGVCDGNGQSCLGCDGIPYSGLENDSCGVCGGHNETCIGCDHMGGGVKDACGVCNGDNSTCNGCVLDACGICNGDGSSCTCVRYHGYHVQELDYLLLRWGFTQSIEHINELMEVLRKTLDLLAQRNDADGLRQEFVDYAALVKLINDFQADYTADYEVVINQFTTLLDAAL